MMNVLIHNFYAFPIILGECIFTSRITKPNHTNLHRPWKLLNSLCLESNTCYLLFIFMEVFFSILWKMKCDDFTNLSWFGKKKITFCCFYFLWFLMRWKKKMISFLADSLCIWFANLCLIFDIFYADMFSVL